MTVKYITVKGPDAVFISPHGPLTDTDEPQTAHGQATDI